MQSVRNWFMMEEDVPHQSPARTIHSSGDGTASFEEAMILTGYGRYNFNLLLVCGLITTSYGCQYGLSAFILPSAQCDLNLTSNEMGLINSAFMFGAIVSALLSGAIADSMGRRNILIWTLAIDGFAALLSSLSQNFTVIFIFRCINGLAVGGPSTVILSFIGEFHADRPRTKAICYLGFFWAFAKVILAAVAWIIIPLEFHIVVFEYVFNSWRLFVGIFGLPSLLAAFLVSKYPETPKFLLSQGQNDKALEILRDIFVLNTKKQAHQYPVKSLVSECSTLYGENQSLSIVFKKMWEQICCLFSPRICKYTILTELIIFANVFGYFGFGLWVPELFNRFEVYYESNPNATVTVCELIHLQQDYYKPINYLNETSNYVTTETIPILLNTTTIEKEEICANNVDEQVFIKSIIIGFCCVLGNLAMGYLSNCWDRRIIPIATMLISGISGCTIYFLQTSLQLLIVTCIFTTFISMANMAVYSVIVHIFPTNVNAMATCMTSVAGRLGSIASNILFGALLEVSCEIPIFFVGCVVLFGGFLTFLLPKNPIAAPVGQLESKTSGLDPNLSIAERGAIHNPEDGTAASFKQAMILTGYGRYNLTVLLVCGLIMTAYACQHGLSAYILPAAQCDLKLTSYEMGLLNAAFNFGATVSCSLFGVIADSMGRRQMLIWTLVIDGCAALLSSLSQDFAVIFVFRCINGLAEDGPSTVIISFLGEFHADKPRTKAICYAGFF